MEITIRRLNQTILHDYLRFFDHIAFVDNKDWEGCYCVFYHHARDIKDWLSRSRDQNRAMAIDLINQDKLSGFLAYHDGQPVGWCNANDKRVFSFDKNLNQVHDDDDDTVISIVCFLVSPEYRNRGIGTKLLRAVIEHGVDSGKRYVEAYPFRNVTTDAENYHGPLGLYRKNGFHIDREYEKYYVMKYDLESAEPINGPV